MEEGHAWKANSISSIQDIIRIYFWSRVHKRQVNLVCILRSYFSTILSSTSRSSKWTLSFKFHYQIFVYIYITSHTLYMPRPYHTSWFVSNKHDI